MSRTFHTFDASSSAPPDLTLHDQRAVEALRHTSAIITLLSKDGEVLLQNPAAQCVFGTAASGARPFEARFCSPEEGRSLLQQLQTRGTYFGEVELLTVTGPRWHAIEGRTAVDPVTGALAFVLDQRDISDRRLAEDAMFAGEARFRALCMQAPVGLLHTDANGRCTFVNARWCEIADVPEYEALGSGWLKNVHPDDQARVLEAWQPGAGAPRALELRFRHRHRDGRDVWVVQSAVPVRGGDGALSGYVSAVSDVTTGVLSEQRFAVVFEQARDAHLFVDDTGTIIDCNQGAVGLYGFQSKAQLLGRSLVRLSPAHQPDGRTSAEMLTTVREQAAEKGSHRFSWIHQRLDGEPFTAEVSVSAVSLDGKRVFFASLHDATERARAAAAIVRSREAALEASRVKSQFLANMSHEIRTPMNGVLGMLLLALGTELTPEQREYLAAAQGSAEGLLAILNDILDLSKIEAGKLDIDRIGFSLEEMLRRCLQVTALRAHAKNLELVVNVADDVPQAIVADPVRLGQVLTNLIGNAVKFTERGQVIVAVSVIDDQGPQLELRVEDSGLGISRERQERVFDAFQQADNSTTRRYGGTGLGLTISKELVSLMGGRLRLASQLGVGSAFTVTLPLLASRTLGSEPPRALDLSGRCIVVVDDHPLARASVAAMLTRQGARVLSAGSAAEAFALVLHETTVDAAFIDHELGIQDGLELPRLLRRYQACADTRFILLRSRERVGRDLLGRAGYEFALDKPVLGSDLRRALTAPLSQTPNTNRHASLPTQSRDAPARRSLQVLVVEDHPVNAHFLCSLLKREGHQVLHAINGVSALHAYERQVFDVILMDMQMPEMDGLEATRRIRAAEASGTRRTPIVALTANAMKGDEDACLAAGMDSYIAKPIDPLKLQRVLTSIGESTPTVGLPAVVSTATVASADSVSEAEPAYGRDALLERACGDPRFKADLIQIFVGSQDEMMRDLEAAIAGGEGAAVRDASHRLKGALQLVCAEPAARLAAQLEQAGKGQQQAAMPALLESLRHEMRRLRAAFGDVG